jgi:hypothetical protein
MLPVCRFLLDAWHVGMLILGGSSAAHGHPALPQPVKNNFSVAQPCTVKSSSLLMPAIRLCRSQVSRRVRCSRRGRLQNRQSALESLPSSRRAPVCGVPRHSAVMTPWVHARIGVARRSGAMTTRMRASVDSPRRGAPEARRAPAQVGNARSGDAIARRARAVLQLLGVTSRRHHAAG